MFDFEEKTSKHGRCIGFSTALKGKDLLDSSALNKGSAFTNEERERLGLLGLLPDQIETIDEQAKRTYGQFSRFETALEKNNYLNDLNENNQVLFYHLASQHLEEMLPILYTPTVGQAVEEFSHEFSRARGIYLSYHNQYRLNEILNNCPLPEVDLIIMTDGEGVLGIGDQGVGGMDICIGKLMVYTLCAGINPNRVLPIQLDVGTNNQLMLDDPMYLGWRHKRISGNAYHQFIGRAVAAIRERFPGVYLHWEDFGRDNARTNLDRYRNAMCTFNDDMQGTGAVTLATVLSACHAQGRALSDQRFVFFGAGTAGTGIADQICTALQKEGLSEANARKRFWLVDRPGLLTEHVETTDFQKPYTRSHVETADWARNADGLIALDEVLKQVKPTVLVGCSTVHGAFTEEMIKNLAEQVDTPIIFPLSNPNKKVEATPEDLIKWTGGKVMIATGSPFDDVEIDGKKIRISQCNNAFIFPGLGLGTIATKATRVTDGMIWEACRALADCSPALKDPSAPLLPELSEAKAVSRKIASAVATQAILEGVASIDTTDDIEARIEALVWTPEYLPIHST